MKISVQVITFFGFNFFPKLFLLAELYLRHPELPRFIRSKGGQAVSNFKMHVNQEPFGFLRKAAEMSLLIVSGINNVILCLYVMLWINHNLAATGNLIVPTQFLNKDAEYFV